MIEISIFHYLLVLGSLYLIQHIYYRLLAYKWNCGNILKIDQDYFGIWHAKKLFEDRNNGIDLQTQREMFQHYKTDTVSRTLIGRELFFTYNLENIKAIVNHQFNDFSIGYRYQSFKPLLGDGIFATEGPVWRHSKEMLRPQFVREQVRELNHLEGQIKHFAARVREFNGQPFDVQEYLLKLTLDASTDFLFGESVGSLSKADYSFGKYTFESAFNKVQKYIFGRSLLQSLYWTYNPRDFRDCLEVIHTFTDMFVDKALSLTPEELEKKSKERYTFMYEIVKVTGDKKAVHDHIMNIMLAGRNTTSALISGIVLELARNPGSYEKLKKEVYESFGDGENPRLEDITLESMKKCNYLRWCVNEGLRMYPSVPQNFRCAKKHTTLPRGGGPDGKDKIFIRKGQAVYMSFYTLLRSEDYYGKDANEFNPDRWETIKNPGAFMPFLSGPRICLGQQYAIAEASYTILRIAQLFPNLKSYETQYPPPILANATMKFRDGVTVSLS